MRALSFALAHTRAYHPVPVLVRVGFLHDLETASLIHRCLLLRALVCSMADTSRKAPAGWDGDGDPREFCYRVLFKVCHWCLAGMARIVSECSRDLFLTFSRCRPRRSTTPVRLHSAIQYRTIIL